MYEYYDKEKLNKMYPILETECEAIINFVSCDGNMGYKLAAVLSDLNPNMSYSFQDNCLNDLIQKGVVTTYRKVTPFIVQLPFKETFKDKPDYEYLRAGFEKIEYGLKIKKLSISSLAIQEGIVDKEMIEEAIKGLDLPEIKYYKEYVPEKKVIPKKEKVEKKIVKNKKTEKVEKNSKEVVENKGDPVLENNLEEGHKV